MSLSYEQLTNLSDEELIERYNEHAQHTIVGIDYYMEEIQRRETEKSNRIMVNCTKAITYMTAVMLLATIANVIIAFIK